MHSRKSFIGCKCVWICILFAYLTCLSIDVAAAFVPNSNVNINIPSYRNIGTPSFAFPDSREHESQEKLRQTKNVEKDRKKSNQQRNYKDAEDEDDKTYELSSTSNSTPRRPQPQRRFRSNNTANTSKHRNDQSSKKQNQYGNNGRNNPRNNSQSQPVSVFTKQLIAPPLEELKLPKKKDDTENIILSPSVIQSNQQECMTTSIYGELPVTYTNDPSTLEKWLVEHCHSEDDGTYHSALGFDVEAAPNLPWRKPTNTDFIDRPATVQLSTPYSSIVVHLTGRSKSPGDQSILSPLIAMLSDETILKVGAGIDDDMLELYRWNKNLDAKSRFDIGGIGSNSSRQRIGLQKLVRAIVGAELLKSKKVAMSDWSQIPLQTKQLCYASRDAWAGAAVMENIGKMYDGMDIDSIGALVMEKERTMADLNMRAKTRKKSKLKMKGIISEVEEMPEFLRGSDKMSGKRKRERLNQIMPEETKREIKRLQKIQDETAPDGLIFFDAEELGLDFSFVSQ